MTSLRARLPPRRRARGPSASLPWPASFTAHAMSFHPHLGDVACTASSSGSTSCRRRRRVCMVAGLLAACGADSRAHHAAARAAGRGARGRRAQRVEGSYPAEVQPLVDDLNALLDHQDAAGRARARQGRRSGAWAEDAARGPVRTKPSARRRPASRISSARSRSRSTRCGARSTITWRTRAPRPRAPRRARAASVAESAEALARTLQRLHAERGLTIDVDASADHVVRCQREDLDEMLGNLLDNACKWARARVLLSTAATDQTIVDRRGR